MGRLSRVDKMSKLNISRKLQIWSRLTEVRKYGRQGEVSCSF